MPVISARFDMQLWILLATIKRVRPQRPLSMSKHMLHADIGFCTVSKKGKDDIAFLNWRHHISIIFPLLSKVLFNGTDHSNRG